MKELITDFWGAMTRPQKMVTIAVLMLLAALFVAGWFNAVSTRLAVRKLENEARQARRDAESALERASKIGGEIRRKQDELREKEEKLDVEQRKLDAARGRTADARRDYDRALSEPVGRTPGADELCAELDRLGYPCR